MAAEAAGLLLDPAGGGAGVAAEPPGRGIEALLASLRADPDFQATVAAWRTVPARAADLAPFPAGLDEGIRQALASRGVPSLYTHQAAAVEHAIARRNVVVVTPTASGKTLCYNLPVLQALRRDPHARALYLFPTKALSQDQVAELTELVRATGDDFRTYTYDGDTPQSARQALRDGGHIVVTNPYMLHGGILPNHPRWTELFQNLAYVVIDELHTYRGVFGSHVANVLRRLRRICRHYGSSPTFVAASATIGNPKELAERLCEAPFELVDRSGAPRGERHYVLVNPPVVERSLGLRVAAQEQVRRLMRRVLPYEVQSIVFARSRNQTEVMLKYMKDAAAEVRVDPQRVVGYRGGYLPKLRRSIEGGLRRGEVRAVVATNALELGVDIGSLDVAVLTGYPGSVASFFQQCGRAGRRNRPSLAVLVARSVPMDQYLCRHPEHLLEAPREDTVIDADNLLIKVNHVKCSAFEVPFREDEGFGAAAGTTAAASASAVVAASTREDPAAPAVHALEGGARASETQQLLDYLALDARLLHKAGGSYYWMAEAYPAQGVSLTASDIDELIVYDVERRTIIGEVDRPSAMTEIHEGAIYGWQGEQYVIERLDYENRRAYARKVSCDYYTEAELDRALKPLAIAREERHPAFVARLGDVEVTSRASVYKKIKFYTRENVGAGEIHLPAEVMDTTALIITIDRAAAAELGLLGPASGALLGLRELFANALPLYIRCDPRDLAVWSEARSPHFEDLPTLYCFDRMPGGTGLAERAFARLGEVLEAMAGVVAECPCERGCPGCVGVDPHLGAGGRGVVRALLARLLAKGPRAEPPAAPAAPARLDPDEAVG